MPIISSFPSKSITTVPSIFHDFQVIVSIGIIDNDRFVVDGGGKVWSADVGVSGWGWTGSRLVSAGRAWRLAGWSASICCFAG